MKVSVVTVVKNDPAGIRETLRSVASQNGVQVEHIIIDGGSSDETLETIRRFSGRDLIVVSEPDSGPYDAMNKGVLASRGDIVATLNAGDVYTSETSLLTLTELTVISEREGRDGKT